MKTHHGNPQRGFPYRKVAAEVVEARAGAVVITTAETRRMAREVLAGLVSARVGAPADIDLRDAAFSLSTALADEIEKAILAELKLQARRAK